MCGGGKDKFFLSYIHVVPVQTIGLPLTCLIMLYVQSRPKVLPDYL